jgi:hypothetical protein
MAKRKPIQITKEHNGPFETAAIWLPSHQVAIGEIVPEDTESTRMRDVKYVLRLDCGFIDENVHFTISEVRRIFQRMERLQEAEINRRRSRNQITPE